MSPLKGNAGFKYDPGAGEVTFALEVPLFRAHRGRRRVRREAWSLDLTAREVVSIGAGVEELVGQVRFETDRGELLDFLEAGAEDVELRYYPDLSLGTNYPVKLVGPTGDQLEAVRDESSRGKLGASGVTIRVRRVDGGDFAGILP